jgi:hypothetical protein
LNKSLDYGHPLEFGYFLISDAGDPHGVFQTAGMLDRLGYDLVGSPARSSTTTTPPRRITSDHDART